MPSTFIPNLQPSTFNPIITWAVLGTKKSIGLKLPTVTWANVVKNVATSNENVPVADGNARMSHGDEETDTDEKRSE
jgi:hypothetical protein